MTRLLSPLYLLWCAIVFITGLIVILPFVLLSAWILKGKKAKDTCFIFIKAWARYFSALSFLPIRVQQQELIDPNKAYIYVANHNSYLDSVAVVTAIPESFKPLGKIEMVKVPLFGILYSKVVVLIDRKSAESRAKCIEALKHELATQQSILIFPEGTMNRTAAPLANFYDGAFRLASETQPPIAPMAIINARNLLPRDYPLQAKPGSVTVIFSEPVSVKGMSEADLPQLKQHVYQIMEELIVKNS